jgi:hypothetical protein
MSQIVSTSKMEMRCPFVSIVILNYNGQKFLENCLRSALDSDFETFEIVLVDNASTDNSVEIAKSFIADSKLKIICLEENLGFSRGNNVGASVASGKYVVFLNNDTVVEKNWLKELVKVMENDHDIGAVQPKLLFLDRPDEVQSAGNFIDTLGFTIPRVRLSLERKKFGCQAEIAATGAALLIRRDLFFHIGGFESNFFAYYEDTDLSWRVRMAGKSILFVPSSIVYHAEGAGFSRVKLAFRLNHYVRNQLFTVFKNYSLRNGFPRLILLCCLYFGGAIWLAARKISDIPKAILKAPFQFLIEFPQCWKSHLNAQVIREVDDKQLFESFLKPFDLFGLFQFYSAGMGYVSVDYSPNAISR